MTTKKRAATAVDKRKGPDIKVEVWGAWGEHSVRTQLLDGLEDELVASNPLIAKGVMENLQARAARLPKVPNKSAPAKKKPTKKAKSKSAQKSAPKSKAPKAAPKAKLAGDLLKALHDLSSGARVAFEVNGTTLNALYKRGLIDLDNKLTAAGTEVVASGNGEARA